MKPAPFEYHVPDSLDEALRLLRQYGSEGKPLAGGQSLIPAMNFRLARPAVLIDLNRLDDLAGIRKTADGGLAIGAMTRQRAVERSSDVAARAPLLAETMPYIAHPPIRNRGTVGGSLAHADPASELPAVMTALDARFRVRNVDGERWVEARQFFLGLFATALAPDDLLTEVVIPPPPPRSGFAFQEFARRHGDYALAGVAVAIELDPAGQCSRASVVLMGVGEGPVTLDGVNRMLVGQAPAQAAFEAAAAEVERQLDPPGDIHASSAYRRRLARVLTQRALRSAAERAQGGAAG